MMSLGALGFAAPWALLGLLALPALWLLLRATPPAPRTVNFPPLRLLLDLIPKEETPQRTPWWVLLLRLSLAAAVIIGLARPVVFPEPSAEGDGPLLLIVDDGWASAAQWRRMQQAGRAALDTAARDDRAVALLFTAERAGAQEPLVLTPPDQARRTLERRAPAAWAPNRAAAAAVLVAALDAGAIPQDAAPLWISDGLAHDGVDDLNAAIARLADGSLRTPSPVRAPLGLSPPQAAGEGVSTSVWRADTAGTREGAVLVLDRDGRAVARAPFMFRSGETAAPVELSLPLEVRNRATLMRLEVGATAGGAQLLDDSWRRPRVGLIAQTQNADRQPLLADLHYVEQALADSAQTERGRVDELLARGPGALVLVDAATPTASEEDALVAYLEAGGLLIRFAGPRLAGQDRRLDPLAPVRLRTGGRLLGGALAWDEPQTIAPFADTSPFFGLTPPTEATVARQVLAEPAPDLDAKTWARLADGTPLVTSARMGAGRLVLFHVTASPAWSDTPLSGLFVDMLARVIAFADASAEVESQTVAGPWRLAQTLGADGQLAAAQTDVRVNPQDWPPARPGPAAAPGVYERGVVSAALNVLGAQDALTALTPPANLTVRASVSEGPRALAGPLLGLALALLVVDALAMLALSGRLRALRLQKFARGGTASMVAALAVAGALAAAQPQPAHAVRQDAADPLPESFALDALGQFRLAYVVTGDREVDGLSEAGLAGLSLQLARRTSVEPGPPLPISLANDEISVLPLLYWPVPRDLPTPSADMAAKLDAFMKSGGVLILDTGDGASNLAAPPHPGLQRLGEALDIPPLREAPPDHVLTRAFYLLQEFPGRWRDTPIWVEADSQGSARDGVSSVIIGSADWAAAWAIDPAGRPMAALTPGGVEQREHAYRVGVNLVMYVLTGNYKADQVHVPAILERLGP